MSGAGARARRGALAAAALLGACALPPTSISVERERLAGVRQRYLLAGFRDLRPADHRERLAAAAPLVRASVAGAIARNVGGVSVLGSDRELPVWSPEHEFELRALAREEQAVAVLAGDVFSLAPSTFLRCSEAGFGVVAYSIESGEELWRADIGELASPCNAEPARWASQLSGALVVDLFTALKASQAPAAPPQN